MDFPQLDGTTDAEARALVASLVKDAERQLVTAAFNRLMNPGPAGANFDELIAGLRAGLARLKASPSWAAMLVEPTSQRAGPA